MWCACIDLESCVIDEFRRGESSGADRHDLVVVAVYDEGRHVEFLEVLGEVGLGERLDAVKRVFMAACIPWRVALLTSFDEARAAAPTGTIWSSSPCMMRVGTSNFLRSSVKSVSENAWMQSSVFLWPPAYPGELRY